MTGAADLAAGSYVVGYWRGALRLAGLPVHHCTHEHPDAEEAQDCARVARLALLSGGHLPDGWQIWGPTR